MDLWANEVPRLDTWLVAMDDDDDTASSNVTVVVRVLMDRAAGSGGIGGLF